MSCIYKAKIADRLNYGAERGAEGILYLVLHYTGNDGDTDEGNSRFFAEHVVQASAHYFVDDDSVTNTVPDNHIAWAVGGEKWSDCEKTGGGKLHGIATNANSISVELCDTKQDGTIMVSEATIANAVPLCRELMRRYGIPIERVVRHFDVTGKHCPAYFMDEAKWAKFKEKLVEAKQTKQRFNTIAEIEEAAPWAADTVRKICDNFILRGGGAAADENGYPVELDMSMDMLRLLVMNDRAGIYDI